MTTKTSFLSIEQCAEKSHEWGEPDQIFFRCYMYGPHWELEWGSRDLPLDDLQKLFDFMTAPHRNIPALAPESLQTETRLLKAGIRIIEPKDVIL